MQSKNGVFILFSLILWLTSNAQFYYTAANSQNVSGTYTDLGTSGTPITTNFNGGAMTYDEDNSSIQNIGFSFRYNGNDFTESHERDKLGFERHLVPYIGQSCET